MLKIVGFIIVIVCVFGGYSAMGGHIHVLWQPFEFVIIFGAGIGAYTIANSKHTVLHTGKGVAKVFKADKYSKEDFLELLSMLYITFKMARTKATRVIP